MDLFPVIQQNVTSIKHPRFKDCEVIMSAIFDQQNNPKLNNL